MNIAVGLLTFFPLFTAAFAHYLWAFGNTWPIRDEALLVQTVFGRAGATRMPNRALTFLVATALLLASVVAFAVADPVSGGIGLTGIALALAAVFLIRGMLGYTPAWRARYPLEPFATLDRRNYSPLCLWVGAGFLILVLMRVA
jgi:amino acid permease